MLFFISFWACPIRYYHERSWSYAYDWKNICRRNPITELRYYVWALRRNVRRTVTEEYVGEVFLDQIAPCVINLRYHDGMDWDEAQKALEYFLNIGSRIDEALLSYAFNAYSAAKNDMPTEAEFYIKAALWAVDKGSNINDVFNGDTALNYVLMIQDMEISEKLRVLVNSLHDKLKAHGAKMCDEVVIERVFNEDYYKELEFLAGSKQSGKVHRK